MTRELKFRAWCEEEKRYTDKPFCQCHDGSCTFLDAVQFINGKVSTLIPEQYTGLKDKNGVEIYEGDIIEVVNLHDGDEECWEQPYGPAIPQEVKWNEERLRWSFGGCGRILYAPEDFEIVGNIHENPELLGGEE